MEHYKNLQIEDIEGEYWIDAFGYDGLYEVSNFGRIKSLKRYVQNRQGIRVVRERILSQSVSKSNRLQVSFSINSVSRVMEVSTLIYYSFNKKNYLARSFKEVIHLDLNSKNNTLENLKLQLISERNIKHNQKTTKICCVCNIEKLKSEFYNKAGKCIPCTKIYKETKYKTVKK